jgi:hypothetical protein
MSSENADLSREIEEMRVDARAPWERPALRRLAANQATGGPGPCDDGVGGGCGPAGQHPSHS